MQDPGGMIAGGIGMLILFGSAFFILRYFILRRVKEGRQASRVLNIIVWVSLIGIMEAVSRIVQGMLGGGGMFFAMTVGAVVMYFAYRSVFPRHRES